MHKDTFDHKAIEQKWQEKWNTSGMYDVGERRADREKEYVLVEWPYPSGNLHVGHWYAFAVPDIYVRMRRMQGVQTIFPMGFDAFGLPAENAAIKHDINPREWTEKNIKHMQNQLASMGNAFSWDKTTSSTDLEYYKWTQWMFTEFMNNDIAYRGTGIVNWDPIDQTVLANEQVLPDGTAERSGAVVEKREMPQWMFRITKYADRLIDDLEPLNWPEHIKEAQRQWIGRSEGAKIPFSLSTGTVIDVFTTRPDTLFGTTHLVFAPEHAYIEKHKDQIHNWKAVSEYIQSAQKKSDQDRLDMTREKTGVRVEGITAENPVNGEQIPVYISDYVLIGYGTGAIMAVPAHDERDHEFAQKFDIAIKQVIDCGDSLPCATPGPLVNSGPFDGMDSQEAKEAITKKVGGETVNTYRLRDWSVGRQRYWGVPIPVVYDPEGTPHPIPLEHLPWTLPADVDFKPTGEPPLAKSVELKERTEKIFGEGWTPEVETMDTFLDSSWYFLRYIDNKNNTCASSVAQQKKWMPVDVYFGGAEHTTMHLLYSRFWQKALYDLGHVRDHEPYKKRINRGLILGPDGNKMSKSKGNIIDPDEQLKRVGADAVKMYLAFMGPYSGSNYPWDMGGIAGIRRFLERVYRLDQEVREHEEVDVTRQLHKTIQKVTNDIATYKFNTAISTLMILTNMIERNGATEATYRIFLRLLAPFAPHLAEELWERAGHTTSIHTEEWPTPSEDLLIDEEVTLAVQFNGKMRGTVTIDADATEEVVLERIKEDKKLKERILSKQITKVIYIPGKIINIIGTE